MLSLLDWKRRVLDLYRAVREASTPEAGWRLWRAGRDELFRAHAQSPLPADARVGFGGLSYFVYDPGMRVAASVEPAPHAQVAIGASIGSPVAFERFARTRFMLDGDELTLDLFWLDAYGGGLFVPFGDATSGSETYGAGRYLLDTVKGADLGADDGRLVLDFNVAYNPACAYSDHYNCPIPPKENRLTAKIPAGESWRDE